MGKEKRYDQLKKLLEQGEKNKVILAKKIGYKGSTEKSLKDSLNRFLNNHLELKQLHSTVQQDPINTKEIEIMKLSNYKSNDLATKNLDIESLDDLIKLGESNSVVRILTEEIINIKKDMINQNKYKKEVETLFILDEKYSVNQTNIIPVSLRMTEEAKDKLDKFAKEHSSYKKIYIVSQMIEEFVNKYK